jgi:hypothetical protein
MFETTSLLLAKDLKSVLCLATRSFLLSPKESPCILHYVMELGKRNSWSDGIKTRDIIPSHLFSDCLAKIGMKNLLETNETDFKR